MITDATDQRALDQLSRASTALEAEHSITTTERGAFHQFRRRCSKIEPDQPTTASETTSTSESTMR